MSTVKKWYEEWVVDDRYFCSVRLIPTTLGEWYWGFMDLETNHGLGGWVNTIDQAHAQVANMLKNAQEDNK